MIRFDNILIARDFSPCSDAAMPYALDLAARTGAMLHTLYAEVLRGDPFQPPKEPATPADKIRERLRAFAEEEALEKSHFDPGSVRFRHAVVRGVAAAPALLDYAEEHGVDGIVMGTHGRRGVRRLMMGSVAEEIVRTAPCPVLTVCSANQSGGRVAVEELLLPVDFSEHTAAGLRHAKALAALYDARLTLLHVVEETLPPALYGPGVLSIYDAEPDIEEKSVERMQKLYQETDGPGGEVRFEARPGHAARTIATYAEEMGAGLIVMPTHGRTGLDHFAMGSVAEKVVRAAPCPVFTLKSFGRSLVEGSAKAEAAEVETAEVEASKAE